MAFVPWYEDANHGKPHTMSELFTKDGQRKYTTRTERDAFIKAANDKRREVQTLCHVLAFTGCRVSEALNLTPAHIDAEAEVIIFDTLKQRGKTLTRAVPVPPSLLRDLELVHQLKKQQKQGITAPLWDWSRIYAYKQVKEVMTLAGIEGAMASPKGLRHGFGVLSAETTRNPRLVMKWLGHRNLNTTLIYMDAVGAEEKAQAAGMW